MIQDLNDLSGLHLNHFLFNSIPDSTGTNFHKVMPAVGRRKPLKSNVKLTLMSCKVFLETGKLTVQYLDGTIGEFMLYWTESGERNPMKNKGKIES